MTPARPFLSPLVVAVALGIPVPGAAFTIDLTFGSGLTDSQQSLFSAEAGFWEGIISGYQDGETRSGQALTGVEMTASGEEIDGEGSVLGSGGVVRSIDDGTFRLATESSMTFDTADLSIMEGDGTLDDVIRHEMAHAIGFGILWQANGVYEVGSGEYTGAHAVAAYRQEFSQPGADSVPVELDGGEGTADGHWEEDVFETELMTGWLDGDLYVSDVTKASFMDIGYTLAPGALTAVPLPGALPLLASAVAVGLLGVGRRRAP